MKKSLSILLCAILILSLAACGQTAPPATPEPTPVPQGPEIKEAMGVTVPAFAINVAGVVVTNESMADYPVYEIQANSVNSTGTESTTAYVGYALSDVFAAAGVTEYRTISAVADDGYAVDVAAEVAALPSTLVAITKDGEQFKSAPWFAPCSSGTTGDYLKGMVAIALDGAEADMNVGGGDEPVEGGLPEIADRTDKVQFAPYSFLVNGVEVTNDTLAGLSIYKIDVTVVNSKGASSESTYTGYKLADVLAACGVEGYEKVSAVTNDGYVNELSPENAGSEYTLVAIERDKETGEDGTIWLAPCLETESKAYAKLVVEITAE